MERPTDPAISIATLMIPPMEQPVIPTTSPAQAAWPFQLATPGARVPRGRALGPWVGARVPTHPENGCRTRVRSSTAEAVKTASGPPRKKPNAVERQQRRKPQGHDGEMEVKWRIGNFTGIRR